MRARKKPVVVDCVEFSGENVDEVISWASGFDPKCRENWQVVPDGIVIPTLEGDHLASPGDFIIRGVAGEFYPCKPDIFHSTYDTIEE